MSQAELITYVRIAEVLTALGMITQEKGRGVVEEFRDVAHEEITPLHHVSYALEDFGAAVSIHAEDVDFADVAYGELLADAAALTGGAVEVTEYRFEKADEDDPEDGRGVMYFTAQGQRHSFGVEQESNDYFDIGAAQAAIEALSPVDDPRDFRCVDYGPEGPYQGWDAIMVLATAEQRAALGHHLGLTFEDPCHGL
ncbi:hypothetical protein OG422_18640 [Streptomyces sp. NBC_01525]|uniref:hypothetical protein n=1 Tax=Streptomyces sp. NBC_01525 TaxID=2903893 RepID=UPI003868515B